MCVKSKKRVNKKIILSVLILLFMPLVFAAGYGSGNYGADIYGNASAPTPTPAPTPDSPSGGSSGSSSCIYDWQCTKWFPSICPESGTQERICANKGTCTGTERIPNQTRTCKYLGPLEPLFDIYLTLEDEYKEVCAGKKIKANIKLENYAKVELLDAFMTYWILDENNKLIAEVKDTRAVEKETNFNIELKIPESTSGGTFRIYAEITYSGDKTAVAGETFEIISQENCSLFSSYNFNWNYLIYGVLGIVAVLFILILIKLFKTKFKIIKKKHGKLKSHKEYKNKIKQNLNKIRSKNFLIIFASFILVGILFVAGKSMTGFVARSASTNNNWNLFGVILIIGVVGLLVFIYRKNIIEKMEIRERNKHARDSIRGLMKKKVYTEEGDYLGKVEDVILVENKIDSLRIKLNKKQKFKVKGIIIKYKDVKSVGHIVIINEKILEKLNI